MVPHFSQWLSKLHDQLFFLQEMLNYVLKPSYEYQVTFKSFFGLILLQQILTNDMTFFLFILSQPKPWTVYSFSGETKKKISFKSVARWVD